MEFLALIIGLPVCICIGIAIGIWIGMGRMRQAVEGGSVGNLRFDRSEPDEPTKPYLEVFEGHTIASISKKKFVILKVVNENYIHENYNDETCISQK